MTGVLIFYLFLLAVFLGFHWVNRVPEPLLNVLAAVLLLLNGSILVAAIEVLGHLKTLTRFEITLDLVAVSFSTASTIFAYRSAVREIDRFTLRRE